MKIIITTLCLLIGIKFCYAQNTQFKYDRAGRLVRTTYANQKLVNYTLDKDGNRTAKTIASNVLPSPGTITGTLNVCVNSFVTLADTAAGGTWSSGNAAIATVGASSGIVTGVAAGTVVITYSVTNDAGTAFATTTVTVNPLPQSITGNAGICTGSSASFNDLSPGGVWSSSNTSVVTVNSGSGNSGGVSAGNGTITYTLPTGCMTAQAVTVNPLPAAIAGAATVCQGSITALADATPDGYWLSNTPAVATVDPAGIVTGISGGASVISYVLLSGCGIASITATVNPLPISLITSSSGAFCGNTTITATNGGSGTIYYQGTISNGTSIAVPSTTQVVSLSGTYYFRARSAEGCWGDQGSITVTIDPVPVAITGTASVCVGSVASLFDATIGGTWTSSNAGVATISATGSVVGIAPGTAVITYILPTGCSTTMVVTVNALPLSINGTLTVCQGLTTDLTDGDGSGSWSSGNPLVATIGSVGTVTGLTAGSSVITYTLGSGCIATAILTVNPLPVAGVVNGQSNVCVGSTITLTNMISGGVWSSTNVAIASISNTGVVTGVSSGNAAISYTVSNSCGTVNSALNVSVNPLPTVGTTSGVSSICVGTPATLSNVVTGGIWSSSDTTLVTIMPSGVITGVAAGLVTISYSVINGCGVAVDIKPVSVVPLAPPISGPSAVCIGSAITLINTLSGGMWSSNNTARATVDISSGIVTGVSAGSVTISYAAGCGAPVTYGITVSTPLASITGTATVCEGATTGLSNTTTGGSWVSDNSGIATVSTSGVVSGLMAGAAIISYSTGGCSVTKAITVNPSPGIISGIMLSICSSTTLILSNAVSGGIWSSSNAAVATVNPSTGFTTNLVAGNATIRYSIGACVTTTDLTVNATPSIISGIATICQGTTSVLSNTVAGGVWSSSNSGIATVSASGTVSGMSAGTATITYANGSCYATKDVTITSTPAAIIGGTPVMCSGTTAALSDAVSGGTWSSSNASVATINPATGFVTNLSGGTTLIRYSIGSCIATTGVTVNTTPAPVGGIATICQSISTSLTNTVSGGIWSSNNTAVATISASGIVTGASAGTSTISYVSNGCSATKVVTVTATPTAITGGTPVVCSGTILSLANTVSGGTWSSSNSPVATINASTGLTTSLGAGTALIRYSIGSCLVTMNLTVNASPSAISGNSATCLGGTSLQGNTVAGGTWSSTNTAVATISATGTISSVSAGTTTISYTAAGCSSTKLFTVVAMPAAISGIVPVICTGTSISLTDAVSGGSWSSSNDYVTGLNATTGGLAGLHAGTAVIRYTIGGICQVTTNITVNATPAAITGASSLCNGGVVIGLADATPSGTWSSSNTSVATVNASGSVTSIVAGTTTISYSVAGCAATKVVTVNACFGRSSNPENGVVINNDNVDVTVYPNPATNTINIKSSVSVNVAVYSPDGKLLITQNDAHEIDMKGLANGVYIVVVYDANNLLLKTERLIKLE